MNKKVLIRILVNTAIGAVLIYVFLKLVNISEVLEIVKKADLTLVFFTFISVFLASIFKALRLKILLNNPKIPALRVIYLNFLSQFLSFTIPVRAGEIAKGVYLSTQFDIPLPKAVIWIFFDRFLDFWMVIVLSLILLLTIPTNLPANIIYALTFLVTVFTLTLFLILLTPQIFRKLVKFLSLLLIFDSLKKFIHKFSEFVIECVDLLKMGFKVNFLIFTLTFLGIAFEALGWYILFSQFIGNLSFPKILLGSMLNSLSFLIPAAPGYAGSAEAAGLAIFSFGLGYDKNISSAVTLITHAINLIAILITGILGLYMLKFNLKLVWEKLFKKLDK